MGKESIILCVTFVLLLSNSSATLETLRHVVQRELQQYYWWWHNSSNRMSVFNISKFKVSQHLWKLFVDNEMQIHVLNQASKLTQDFMSNQVSIFSTCSRNFLKLRSKVYAGITDDVPTKLWRGGHQIDLNNIMFIKNTLSRCSWKDKEFYCKYICKNIMFFCQSTSYWEQGGTSV